MRVDQFDFVLPEDLIALRPASPRDSARLLVVGADGSLRHAHIRDLPELLAPGDIMVLNDTKVILARLHGVREARRGADGGARVEVLLHRRLDPARFQVLARPMRRLRIGDALRLGRSLAATVDRITEQDGVELRFALEGPALDAAIAAQGEVPLPPYIAGKRKADSRDTVDYQTVFAAHEGSVAAPTAGLHFTPELLARLAERGVGHETVTLHVGAGTFLPVSAADTSEHHMHPEWANVTAEAASRLNAARRSGGRIVGVGTTSLRTLETAADREGAIAPFCGETGIFITPGYRFRTADVLLTNFHLPRSTLFMLVSAFSGLDVMRAAYAEAIRQRYRFYSYGDACLLFRRP
jgi:S-adenosylmethionine:tRNA ribosyltransferase-isomerase